MNFDTLLVPVDWSECSALVAEQAAQLAAKVRGRIVLLHVSELPGGVRPDASLDGGTVGERLRADAALRLHELRRLVEADGVPTEIRVELGPIVPSIIAAIDAVGAGLVVMGTHGRTGVARLVLGSVAEAVVHGAKVPVMLVRRQPRPSCAHERCDWCAAGGLDDAEARLAAETAG